jgi:hypothetical protein
MGLARSGSAQRPSASPRREEEASRRLASAHAKPGTRPLLILGQAPRQKNQSATNFTDSCYSGRFFSSYLKLTEFRICWKLP